MKDKPKVSIIIINYNGKHFLNECLTSIRKMDFPADKYEIILVDNDSRDNSVEYIKENFPNVKVVQSDSNLGFAGGCNLGVKNALGEFIVLLNTDTRVEKSWLKELVRSIKMDKNIAAVNSKILLYYPFFELTINSDIFMRSEFSDTVNFQSVGVLVESIIIEDKNLQPLIRYRRGFYEDEKGIIPARWTEGNAGVLIPVNPHKETVKMTVTVRSGKSASGLETKISVKLGEKELIIDKLKSYQVKQYEVSIPTDELKKHFLYVVQNSGVVLFRNGYGRDRGTVAKATHHFYEPDGIGFYNKRVEIHAFSGASVILRKKIFEDLGGFDEQYFMYYEDVDLSLRMKRQGWKIMYEPKSVIYHIHSGSSEEWSRFFNYHVEKNYLATLIKHFPLNEIIRAFLRYIGILFVSILKMIKWRLSEHWELYDYWRERVEFRVEVFRWITQNLGLFIVKRFKINMVQKRTMDEIYRKLY